MDKCGFGAFTTWNVDFLLRNARISSVVVVGVVTNGCVRLSALGALDLGYAVTVVADACAGLDEVRHEAALDLMQFLGVRIASTDDILTGPASDVISV